MIYNAVRLHTRVAQWCSEPCLCFNPELRLHSVWSLTCSVWVFFSWVLREFQQKKKKFYLVLWFPSTSHKHARRWFDVSKLPQSVNECVKEPGGLLCAQEMFLEYTLDLQQP